ncbi:MAG: hypothetical protein QXQ79_00585 [Candidatus Nanoarchaeia archaeon]
MLLRFEDSIFLERKFIEFLLNFPELFYLKKGIGNFNFALEFHAKDCLHIKSILEKIKQKFKISDFKISQILSEQKCIFFPLSNKEKFIN